MYHISSHFSFQTKNHIYLLRKLFEILYSDKFCTLHPFKVLHHLNTFALHFNCTKCFQKNGYRFDWAITNFSIWFFMDVKNAATCLCYYVVFVLLDWNVCPQIFLFIWKWMWRYCLQLLLIALFITLINFL